MLRMSKSGTNTLLQSMLAGLLLVGASAVTVSCDAPSSKEDLNPAGPPMVRQVMVTEKVIVNDAPRVLEGQLAFGTHANEFFKDDDGTVTTAISLGAQEIRVILDEIIRGNTLEEVACADGSFSRIPNGTTPDDIARCAGPVDAITNCTKVCIGPDGAPVGVLDADDDSAADDFRMIDYNDDPNITELGIAIECDGTNIPLDPEASFWSPSGNQTFPSNETLGFRGLGPAIVVKPLADVGLRSGSDCTIRFRPEVTDYDGNPVCAPTGGLPAEGCSGPDTSKISFNTEVLTLSNSVPSADEVNVSLDASGFILLAFNANLDASTIAAITLTEAGAPIVINPVAQAADLTSVIIMMDNDFLPDTAYALTISTDLKDLLGGGMTAPTVLNWTTGPASANTPPTVTAPADQAIDMNDTSGALAVTVSDAETATAALVLTAASSNTALVDAAEIVLGGADGARTITITPKNGQTGTTTITLTVDDGTTTTDATFDVTVS